ncbi:uncharacterized protein LOC121747495 [Salvia splendens]|uniref:uncharacterized protein LOC121747495 n=1 Tax=Salvia splendens TaxID=180675 RepID=UPI001C26CDD1|nr:uncharacterized protein LOC121747495 [Salvia splendens]
MAPPTADNIFGLSIHHGGHFIPNGKFQKYIGGGRTKASGLDPDRFGYFDLIEELNKIGIETWSRLTFVNPVTATHVDIKSDKEVMEMLSSTLSVSFNRMCSIYVVDRSMCMGGEAERVVVKSTETHGIETFSKIVSEDGSKSFSDSVDENMSGSAGKNVSHGVSTSTDQNVGEKNVLGDGGYDSESDGSYIPSSDEETDDEMEGEIGRRNSLV